MINNDCLEEIVFPPHIIEIRKDGIYRINIYAEESVKIFHGEFKIIGYQKGRHLFEDFFIVVRNDEFYMGNFKELMKQLRPYRGQRLDCFKKIFNHYTREFVEEN